MENGKHIRVLTIKYDTPIEYHEVPLFRGAVNAVMGGEANILFHNHVGDDKFRYSYPLIQYKRLGGKAAIVCLNEGAEEMAGQIDDTPCLYKIGNKEVTMSIDRVRGEELDLELTDTLHPYHIQSWQPLNEENYHAYKALDSLIDKIELLQNILVGNILSMARGLGINIDGHVKAVITDCSPPVMVKSKGVQLITFDIDFKTNITLPQNIGLGKGVSKGRGTVTQKKV